MALSRKAIKKRLEAPNWDDRLVIDPLFDGSFSDDLVSASIDVHLGNRFTYPKSRRAAQHDPLSGNPTEDVVAKELFIPMGKDFSINPGQFLLATTLEWFRFPSNLMAYVIGRSVLGRRSLLIVTASAVQPGTCNTITLEMSNLGEVAIKLKPGVAIGQLFFHDVRDVGAIKGLHSNFGGSLRPLLGVYKRSTTEEFLMSL
jgi:dCTP deaminase